jgi:hypothetical protein
MTPHSVKARQVFNMAPGAHGREASAARGASLSTAKEHGTPAMRAPMLPVNHSHVKNLQCKLGCNESSHTAVKLTLTSKRSCPPPRRKPLMGGHVL